MRIVRRMTVSDELKVTIDGVLSDDPRTALMALRRLTDDELPWIEARVVALARRENWNWATIGRLLGRSRASVRQRFDHARLSKRPAPPTWKTAVDRELRAIRETSDELERRRQCDAADDSPGW